MRISETLAILNKIGDNTIGLSVDFTDKELGVYGAILLAQALETNSSIEILTISDNNVGNLGAEALASVFKTNTTLKKLSLSRIRVGYLGIKELASALETNKTIKIVEFDKITIHYASALELGKVLQFNSSITVFVLSSCNLNNLSLCKLAEALKGNTSLKSLNLYNNKFRSTGVKALCEALENNTTLEELNLKENYLGDSGGRVIADGLNKTSIKTLDIGYCCIGNAGARALTEALKGNKSLTSLMIDNNKYNYDSLSSLLEALKVNRTLKCIYANYFTVYDDDNYMSNSNSNHITLVLLLCEILRLNPTFEKLFLPHIEFNDNQLRLLLDEIEKHKHIEDFYYTSKNLNSIFSGKIVSILEKNKIIKSIRSKLRQNSFVLEILPEEMWELICDNLSHDGLVNFNLALRLKY
jgi:Ran GTPase-activating protein (RanGAP) involved in mRNA processing and transport